LNGRWLAAIAVIVAFACGCETTRPTASPAIAASPAPPQSTSSPAAAACANDVVWPPHDDLPSIRAEIESRAIALGELHSIGDGAGVVTVSLSARSECLARGIVAAYGSNVDVTVGLLPFPPRAGADAGCPPVPWPFGATPGLTAALRFEADRVKQGESLAATVRFANLSFGNIDVLTSSSFPIYVFAADPDRPVGAPDGPVAGTGLGFTLAPAEGRDDGAYGGTASCSARLGYVLPVGTYRARALVDLSPPEGGLHVFWTDPVPLEVVAP